MRSTKQQNPASPQSYDMKARTERAEPIVVDLSQDKVIDEPLNAQSKNTRTTYCTYMKRLTERARMLTALT